MGALCSGSLTPDEKEAHKMNKLIEQGLIKDRQRLREETKLLLLGSGESGKSTIFKQMKIISLMKGFTKEELENYKIAIIDNAVSQMKILIEAANAKKRSFDSDKNLATAQRIDSMMIDSGGWDLLLAEDITALWNDSTIRAVHEERDPLYQLAESAPYFFENISRFVQRDFVPTFKDVLLCRVKTSGIEEATFDFEDISFKMLDVGGQRSERRKWIHCFEGVTAIIFCVAMSEYDQTLREDPTKNRMEESLALWDEISNSQWFAKTAFILFLNKLDLFKAKIRKVDMKVTFPDYTGGCKKKNGKAYVKKIFLQKVHEKEQSEIFPHFTVAVDTNNVSKIFKGVRTTILKGILGDTFTF